MFPLRLNRKLCAALGAAFVLSGTFYPASGIAAQPIIDTGISYPVKACPKTFSPDALGALARVCAKDPSSDANCREKAEDKGESYVVIKDCSPAKPQGYLLVPVLPVTGIEDPAILTPGFSRLWQDAWLWSKKFPGQPAERTALAINSKAGRSQNQLHIHMSCVLPSVSRALQAADVPAYPAKAVTLQLGSAANSYQAVKVTSLTGKNNPFNVIQANPGVADDMQDQSIAVLGTKKPDEYYVLDTAAHGSNRGHAEELLDQKCSPLTN